MDGIHDLGGKHGFGTVVQDLAHEGVQESVQKQAVVFHARWEAKVFAMVNAAASAGAWHNTDRFRHLVERIDPIAYLSDGYYGRWLGGLETGLVEAGILSQTEIAARLEALGGDPQSRVAARPVEQPDPLGPRPSAANSDRDVREPRFSVGDSVTTVSQVKAGHTRLPAYARGKSGVIIASHGGWVYPDTNAHGLGEQPQNLYTVQFTSETLWGPESESGTVCLDLFEPYFA